MDPSVRCFLYLFENKIEPEVSELVTALQLGDMPIRTGAVDCSATAQRRFCNLLGYSEKPIFVGLAAHVDRFVVYDKPYDLQTFQSWAADVTDSLEDCNYKEQVPFPKEDIDPLIQAQRRLKKGMAPILQG